MKITDCLDTTQKALYVKDHSKLFQTISTFRINSRQSDLVNLVHYNTRLFMERVDAFESNYVR
ncbi:MAG: hypothetical protein FWG68_12105 [Defluviitaleaceae bacterium]|nr:hypothetical protein [Defluviitaleaceae bacterium]